MASLSKHMKSDKVKWIATLIAIIVLLSAVIGVVVVMNRQFKTTELTRSAYEVGLLDEDGLEKDGDTAIRTRKFYAVDGLKIEVPETNTEFEYAVYFYDKDEKFISAVSAQTADFASEIPEGAEYFKVMITPLSDSDGKIGLLEVRDYSELIVVTINR